jgi:hypothetical protein
VKKDAFSIEIQEKYMNDFIYVFLVTIGIEELGKRELT